MTSSVPKVVSGVVSQSTRMSIYDGTSYTQHRGRWRPMADTRGTAQDRRSISCSQSQRISPPRTGSLMLVTVPRLFDDGTLMENADALAFWVSDPYVGLSRDDAGTPRRRVGRPSTRYVERWCDSNSGRGS